MTVSEETRDRKWKAEIKKIIEQETIKKEPKKTKLLNRDELYQLCMVSACADIEFGEDLRNDSLWNNKGKRIA